MDRPLPSRLLRYGLPVLVFGLLLLRLADSRLHLLPATAPLQEQRALAPLPKLELDYLDGFPPQTDAWFNDHFYGRAWLVRTRRRIDLASGKLPRLEDKTVIGRYGWFFKGGLQMELYRGTYPLRPEQLTELVDELNRRREAVEVLGGRYYLAIAPLKHHVYTQFLPENARQLSSQFAARRLLDALAADGRVACIDLHRPLQNYRTDHPHSDTLLYFRTDHHWTNLAGLIATRTIVDRLREDFPAIPPFRREDYRIELKKWPGMTLAKMAGLEDRTTDQGSVLHPTHRWRADSIPRPELPRPPGFAFPQEYVFDYRQPGRPDLPTIFVNRESFGQNLVLPLSDFFSRSFYLFNGWEHQLNLTDYEREGGDIYLELIWEGLLPNLLRNKPDDGRW